MGDTFTNDFGQSGSLSQNARFDVYACTMFIERGFLTISNLDQMFVDLLTRVIVNGGTAGQDHAVSIVIDHVRCRTDNADAYDSLGEISQSIGGEIVAEDEGIEPIQSAKLIECDLTATCTVSSGFYLVEAFQEENCLLNPICFGRTRRSTKEFANCTRDQACHAFSNLASHKLVDDISYKVTKSALFG